VKQVFLEALSDLHDDDTLSMRVPAPPTADLDWETFNRLAEWTADSIEEIGIERTIGLVEIYSRRGVFADEARDVLLQAVNLYSFYEANGALDLEFENPAEDTRQEMTPRERRRSLIIRLVEGFQNMNSGQEQSYG